MPMVSLLPLLFVPCHGLVVPALDLSRPARLSRATIVWGAMDDSSSKNEPDVFEYFDPRISPHAYPEGVEGNKENYDNRYATQEKGSGSGLQKEPFGLDIFRKEFPIAFAGTPLPIPTSDADSEANDQLSSNNVPEGDDEELDLLDVFDPRISPHKYPDGIPSTKKRKQKRKVVGILLMDHGSRSEASNQRLHNMARLYQNSVRQDTNTVIVKAAHMEIATPSIPEVLQSLVNDGVDEIICHPYFLSPGRHVMEDIPRIIESAVEELAIDIPVLTTNHVGSHTDMMINAIHSMVQESSTILSQQNRKFGF